MAFRQQTGGRSSHKHRPAESELIALACGYAMILCYCAGDYVKTHSVTLSAEVFRAGGSTQEWCHDEIYNYVRETMFRYLPAGDVKKTIEKNLDLDGDAKKVADFAFIQSCGISMTTQKTLCKYANKQAVKVLFEKAKLDTILKLEVLGGDPSWTSEMINTVEDQDDKPVPIWSVLGPADISKLLHDWLRDMKAYADGIPEDEYYKYTYTGNRKLVAKNTDQLTLTVARSDKRKRGMADLDQTGQGVKESYQRKIELLRKAPYSAMDAASVIKQMLCAREGQAGEQGGALLASFVVLKKEGRLPANPEVRRRHRLPGGKPRPLQGGRRARHDEHGHAGPDARREIRQRAPPAPRCQRARDGRSRPNLPAPPRGPEAAALPGAACSPRAQRIIHRGPPPSPQRAVQHASLSHRNPRQRDAAHAGNRGCCRAGAGPRRSFNPHVAGRAQ